MAAVRCPALLQPSVSSWWTLQAHGCSAPSCPPLGTSSSPCSYVVYGVLAMFWLPRSVSSKSAKLQLALSSVAVLHRVLTLLSYCAIPRPSVEGIDLVTRPNLELDPHMSPPPEEHILFTEPLGARLGRIFCLPHVQPQEF